MTTTTITGEETMSIVPAPYRTAATAGIRLETARAEYLKQREELQDAAKTPPRRSTG